MARVPKAAPPAKLLTIPPPIEEVKEWLILGIDPSLSRTGFAFALAKANEPPVWLNVGSVLPADTSDPSWIRSTLMGRFLKEKLVEEANETRGLIVSFESPTMGNDYLNTINKVLHTVLFDSGLLQLFYMVKIQHTNASTLRSLMGLIARGASNKKENKNKAWEYVDKSVYPELDTDSCDGVLLAMMGYWTAQILLDKPYTIPHKVLVKLTDSTLENKGTGKNAYTQILGSLHRPEYFTTYSPRDYEVKSKDAKSTAKRLNKSTIHV